MTYNTEIMESQLFHIIGISDNPDQELGSKALEVISRSSVFSGGQRHRELMARHLPEQSVWIPITVPISSVIEQYRNQSEIVVFASGDPLFFGFAATVQRELPHARIEMYPYFNSMQMLAHRLLLPYQQMKPVSLTGRPWKEFDASLIEGEGMIGVLTDRNKTPQNIAMRMLEYGYDNYTVHIGEQLGNPQEERIRTLTVAETAALGADGVAFPNCLILEKTADRKRPFGIPEKEFNLLDGREKMITKAPIRLLTLSMLDLRSHQSFWDIGFCTGSISIEAKMQFPHIDVTAFEIRPQGEELMRLNTRKFGTPGINAYIGDFLEFDATSLPSPDAVFIGGHGGKIIEFIRKIHSVLKPGGVIVFNSVSEESKQQFIEGIHAVGLNITAAQRIVLDAHNPIEILKAE